MSRNILLHRTTKMLRQALRWAGVGRQPARRPLDLAALEDRILLSATPLASLAPPDGSAAADSPIDSLEHQLTAHGEGTWHAPLDAPIDAPFDAPSDAPSSHDGASSELPTAVESPRLELVFVDPAADGHQQLVEDLLGQSDAERLFKVVLLDAQSDGLLQIGDTLQQFSDVQAVHLLSHGDEGRVQLGNVWVSADSLDGYAADLTAWRDHLGDGADLLIYGCDVAGDEAGRALAEALHQLTGADVAASDDPTGHAYLGGDWELEFATGAVQSHVALSAAGQESWHSLLVATPASGDVLVNETTAGTQQGGDVAVLADGSFVAVYDSPSDGDAEGVYGRFLDPNSVPLGGEFLINQTTVNSQHDPAVATDAAGNFAVAWASTQGGDTDIYVRLYDPAGAPLTGELLVNSSHTTGEQLNPDVAMDDAGNFVVVWEGEGNDPVKGLDNNGVWGRLFDSTGTAASATFLAHDSATATAEDAPAVAMDADGDFVVVWADHSGPLSEIHAQRFDGSANPLGQFLVQDSPVGEAALPSVAMDDAGNFVVAWGEDNADSSQYGVHARRFDSTGAGLSSDVLVNVHTGNAQTDPSVAMDADGDYVVSWTSMGQDGSNQGVFARSFFSDGTPDGGELAPVNAFTTGSQAASQVSLNDSGRFVVVWQGQGASDADGVHARAYSWATGSPVGPLSDADLTPDVVAEDALLGDPVGVTAFATDPDLSDNVTYSLDDDAGGLFAIDAATGVVTVNGPLDAETAASHNIIVRATSDDSSFSTLALVITVTDVDEFNISVVIDVDPALNEVLEGAANGTVVGLTAFADDPDVGDSVTYSMVNDAGGRFQIDAAGVVTVANGGLIDFETNTSHTVVVQATSTDGSVSIQPFMIAVLDNTSESGVGPIVDSDAAPNMALENAPPGSAVGITALAVDADPGDSVSYSLDVSAGGRFAIDAATGVVTVNGPLDAESAGSHSIMIRATSTDGTFSLLNQTVVVGDVNEFGVSALSDANPSANIVSDLATNNSAVGIQAVAADADASDTVTYSLDDNAGGRFQIHPGTGVITVADSSLLDFEAAEFHTVTVRATSSDGSFRTASFTINVTAGAAPIDPPAPPDPPPPIEPPEPPPETPSGGGDPDSGFGAAPAAAAQGFRRSALSNGLTTSTLALPVPDPDLLDSQLVGHDLLSLGGPGGQSLTRGRAGELLESFATTLRFDAAPPYSQQLWDDFKILAEEMHKAARVPYFEAGAVFGLSSVFTVGYMLWTVRGGWLMTSLLAQMPAWQLIDPLVVLDGLHRLTEDENDESLESLVSKQDGNDEADTVSLAPTGRGGP